MNDTQDTLQNRLQADMSVIRDVCEGYIEDCMKTLRRAAQKVSLEDETLLTLSMRHQCVNRLDQNLQHLFHIHDLLFPKLHKISLDGYVGDAYDEHKVEALRTEWKHLVDEFRGE